MPLYHGSRFLRTDDLRPAFHFTHKLVKWDQHEDNTWLYATTNRDEAIRQGFYSLLSSELDVSRIQSAPDCIAVTLYPEQSPQAELSLAFIQAEGAGKWLAKQVVYLYELPLNSDWKKNANLTNGLTTEWKTQHVIPLRQPAQSIPIGPWLTERGYTLRLTHTDHQPSFMRW